MGELLRRYWHPVAPWNELSDDQPTRFVRLLGEDLVLFKDRRGRVGLVGDHCPHRGASLLYGRVEERGIACAYHGWLYDIEGNCLETPAEPADSHLHLTIKHKAYPVQLLAGLYWAYLGPRPAPVIPKIDIFVRTDGVRSVDVYPQLDCSWLQAMENSADPFHPAILHQDTISRRSGPPPSTTRGFVDNIESIDFEVVPHGIMKKRDARDGTGEEQPLIFPNMLRQGTGNIQIRVPMDDTHTYIVFVNFTPGPSGNGASSNDEVAVQRIEPFKTPAGALHPFTKFRMDIVLAQDHMAWETQGPIADRTVERLATSDQGIVLYRQLLMENIERVQQGLDPFAVVRDPAHDMIVT
jgi:5,5'-dehydrodivanillate O-demethylase